MPIDTGIYNALMRPKSSADYAAEYDAQDFAQQRRQMNALALAQGRDQAAERTRGLQESETLRNALAGLGQNATDDQRINAMQGTGLASGYAQADVLRQSLAKRDQGAASAGKDRADTFTKLLTAQGDLAGRVMANPSRESAAAAVANMKMLSQQLGVQMDFSADDAALQQLQTPEDFQRWAAGHALKAQELLPKVSTVNTGGAQVTQAVDPLTGRPTETGRVANTQSPDSKATIAQRERESLRVDARAREATGVAQAQGKVPAGYRQTADGNLEAIKGGPADLKLQGALNADTQALGGTTASLDRLATSANEVLSAPGLAGVYGLRGAVPNIPGTDAANAAALLNTLKSQVGFGVLQDMRNNSKTGGALGAVSDKENAMLQANLAALEKSQSVEQAQASLKKIIEYTDSAKGRLRDAYNMKHGGGSPAAPAAPAAGANSVTTPDGQVHTFPNAAAAAAFKKAAGL